MEQLLYDFQNNLNESTVDQLMQNLVQLRREKNYLQNLVKLLYKHTTTAIGIFITREMLDISKENNNTTTNPVEIYNILKNHNPIKPIKKRLIEIFIKSFPNNTILFENMNNMQDQLCLEITIKFLDLNENLKNQKNLVGKLMTTHMNYIKPAGKGNNLHLVVCQKILSTFILKNNPIVVNFLQLIVNPSLYSSKFLISLTLENMNFIPKELDQFLASIVNTDFSKENLILYLQLLKRGRLNENQLSWLFFKLIIPLIKISKEEIDLFNDPNTYFYINFILENDLLIEFYFKDQNTKIYNSEMARFLINAFLEVNKNLFFDCYSKIDDIYLKTKLLTWSLNHIKELTPRNIKYLPKIMEQIDYISDEQNITLYCSILEYIKVYMLIKLHRNFDVAPFLKKLLILLKTSKLQISKLCLLSIFKIVLHKKEIPYSFDTYLPPTTIENILLMLLDEISQSIKDSQLVIKYSYLFYTFLNKYTEYIETPLTILEKFIFILKNQNLEFEDSIHYIYESIIILIKQYYRIDFNNGILSYEIFQFGNELKKIYMETPNLSIERGNYILQVLFQIAITSGFDFSKNLLPKHPTSVTLLFWLKNAHMHCLGIYPNQKKIMGFKLDIVENNDKIITKHKEKMTNTGKLQNEFINHILKIYISKVKKKFEAFNVFKANSQWFFSGMISNANLPPVLNDFKIWLFDEYVFNNCLNIICQKYNLNMEVRSRLKNYILFPKTMKNYILFPKTMKNYNDLQGHLKDFYSIFENSKKKIISDGNYIFNKCIPIFMNDIISIPIQSCNETTMNYLKANLFNMNDKNDMLTHFRSWSMKNGFNLMSFMEKTQRIIKQDTLPKDYFNKFVNYETTIKKVNNLTEDSVKFFCLMIDALVMKYLKMDTHDSIILALRTLTIFINNDIGISNNVTNYLNEMIMKKKIFLFDNYEDKLTEQLIILFIKIAVIGGLPYLQKTFNVDMNLLYEWKKRIKIKNLRITLEKILNIPSTENDEDVNFIIQSNVKLDKINLLNEIFF